MPNHFVLTEKGWLSYFNTWGQPIFQPTQATIFYQRNALTAELAKMLLEDLGFTEIFIVDEHYQDARSTSEVALESWRKIRDSRED